MDKAVDNMQYRHLGHSDLRVSILGLGASGLGTRTDLFESHRILDRARDAGITLIDTANVYGKGASELAIGTWLPQHRSEVIIASKAGLPVGRGAQDRGASRSHLTRELEGSLRRLRTDYIDLYQVHIFDPWTPLEETLETLQDFVQVGKVRYVGASNYRAWELMTALGISERRHLVSFVSHQGSYSLADRTPEREMVPLLRNQGLSLIAYFPLGSGLLTGKYRPGEPAPPGSRGERATGIFPYQDPSLLALAATVQAVADEIHARPAHVALAWLWHHDVVASTIAGARLAEQLQENLAALTITLPEDARRRLDAASARFAHAEPLGEYRLDDRKDG